MINRNRIKRGVCLFLALIFFIGISGCGQTKIIDNVEYDTYELLNSDDKRNPDIEYEIVWGNVFWGVVLVETIIAPIYFFGFHLFEPVGKIDHTRMKGAVRHT